MQAQLTLFLVRLAEDLPVEGPEPEDVKAGWLGFGVFLVLVAAVVLLSFSLVKQLRKAQAAKDAGVYGDEPAASGPDRTGDRAD
jgi:hypothetical protein